MEPKRPKVLIAAYLDVPGVEHAASVVLYTAKALCRFFDVDVMTVRFKGAAHMEMIHRARHMRVAISGDTVQAAQEGFIRAVRRQLESEEYVAAHAITPLAAEAISEMRNEMAIRFVYDIVSPSLAGAHQQTQATRADRQERAAMEAADLIVVHSQAAREHLAGRHLTDKVVHIPPGVDIDFFDWEVAEPKKPPMVLVLGNADLLRDPDLVIRSTAAVVKDIPLRLKWVGVRNEDRRKEIHKKAAAANLRSFSTDELEDYEHLPLVIASADIILLPSIAHQRLREMGGLPGPLLECLACKRPVISARVTGVEEVIREGTEALLYSPGDPSSLIEALRFLLRNEPQRRRLAEKGYKHVREAYPASAFRRRLLAAYRSVLRF